ncbi:MAG TPA: HAD-IIIA family hydrolase, partial [Blastocatellia bacterium]|nr:HAD-IIIA family hydrolase [Blastocatellia bacterium]
EFLPQAKEALAELSKNNLRLIIVTNQRGIALGLMTEQELWLIHQRMVEELNQAGAKITAIYHCPHDRNQCACRKPQTGLFLKAKEDFPEIDFARSVMIGDSVSDIEAGIKAGCQTIFIGEQKPKKIKDALSARTLIEAVRCIIPKKSNHE